MLDQLDTPDQLALLEQCCDRLDVSQAQTLLAQGGFAPSREGDRRRYPRRRVNQPAPMQMITTLPAVPRNLQWHAIRIVDVSRGGLGVLHSEQLYPTERLRVVTQDSAVQLAEVVWCQRIADCCYQVGCTLLP